MFVDIPSQVAGYGFVGLVDFLEVSLGDLVILDGVLVGVDHFGQVTISLFDLFVAG